jgi:ribokinase
MSEVVVLGIFVADAAFRADRQPRIGETILGHGFQLGPGGKGSNQAVAAGRAGGRVTMLTKLGRDTFGDMALSIWSEAGVTSGATRVDGAATGAAFIFLEEGTGNNAIIVAPGVAGTISRADVDGWRGTIAGARVFVTQLEQPLAAADHALRVARGAGVTTILNPAPAAELPEGMLAASDWITPNESEAEGLTGIAVTDRESAEAAARRLHEMGSGRVVVTLGERGALLHDGRRAVHVPAMPAGPVVDTTGAGDAFNGGLAAALAEGMEDEAALRFASAVAGLSVTRPGAAASMPERSEIEARLAGA